MRPFLLCAVLAVMNLAMARAQSVPSNPPVASAASAPPNAPPSAGLELLKEVAKRYAEAKSYYIQSVEETSSSSEYDRSWQKTAMSAAEAPGGRFHYEGTSFTGSAAKVSDGKTVWTYEAGQNRYTSKPTQAGVSGPTMMDQSEMAMLNSQRLGKEWGDLIKGLNSAELLPEAVLTLDGHQVLCQVARVQSSDEKRLRPVYVFDKTIWIDKSRKVVVKVVEQSRSSGSGGERVEESTFTYPIVEFDGQVPEGLFTFVPPSGALLVEQFPDPMSNFGDSNLTGRQLPALRLKSAKGNMVPIESFRGKPLLIDFWATWCAPCIAGLPGLAQIYGEGKDKGLAVVGVDQDEEATAAADFLAKKGYTWPNFHDGDGEIEKAMRTNGIPRTVLVDAQGTVVYDATDSNEDHLRTAIAKLGPEFAALQTKPRETPGIAAK